MNRRLLTSGNKKTDEFLSFCRKLSENKTGKKSDLFHVSCLKLELLRRIEFFVVMCGNVLETHSGSFLDFLSRAAYRKTPLLHVLTS